MMTCENLMGKTLIDFIYGKLADMEAKTVREHLEQCPSCRSEAEEIGETLRALDAVEGAFKCTGIAELDQKGYVTSYMTMDFPNESSDPMETLDFKAGRETEVMYVAVNGEEMPFDELPGEPSSFSREYRGQLRRQIRPRQKIEFLVVSRNPIRPVVEKIGRQLYRFGPGVLNLTEDLVYVVALRLPPKAALVEATPDPQEIRKNGVTTVVWRSVLPANAQLEFWADYALKGGGKGSGLAKEAAAEGHEYQSLAFGSFGEP